MELLFRREQTTGTVGRITVKLQEAFVANTSIKPAGGVSVKYARALAPMLCCDQGLIKRQPKGSFAAYMRGVTKAALPLSFPCGHLEKMPTMTPDERAQLQMTMRSRCAVHYTELTDTPPDGDGTASGTPGNADTSTADRNGNSAPQAPRTNGPDASSTDASPTW